MIILLIQNSMTYWWNSMTFHDHSHFPWLSRPGKFLLKVHDFPRFSRIRGNPGIMPQPRTSSVNVGWDTRTYLPSLATSVAQNKRRHWLISTASLNLHTITSVLTVGSSSSGSSSSSSSSSSSEVATVKLAAYHTSYIQLQIQSVKDATWHHKPYSTGYRSVLQQQAYDSKSSEKLTHLCPSL